MGHENHAADSVRDETRGQSVAACALAGSKHRGQLQVLATLGRSTDKHKSIPSIDLGAANGF